MRDKFVGALFSGCRGYIELRALPKGGGRPIQVFKKVGDGVSVPACENYNHFFGVATRATQDGKKSAVLDIPAVWADIDFKDTPGGEAVARLRSFPIPFSIAVLSGGGFHVYWLLREPAGQDDIPAVEAVNRGLAEALGGDPASTDAARILRLPETLNLKYNPPVLARVVEAHDFRYNLSDFSDFRLDEKPSAARKSNGDAIDRVWRWCSFMRHCEENAVRLPEQEWYAMISNLSRVPGGVDKIHDISRPHPKYTRRETDAKILHAVNSSEPMTCRTISRFYRGCKDCKAPDTLFVGCPAAIRLKGE